MWELKLVYQQLNATTVNKSIMEIVKIFVMQDTIIINHSVFLEDALKDINLMHLEDVLEVQVLHLLQVTVKPLNTDKMEDAFQNAVLASTLIL